MLVIAGDAEITGPEISLRRPGLVDQQQAAPGVRLGGGNLGKGIGGRPPVPERLPEPRAHQGQVEIAGHRDSQAVATELSLVEIQDVLVADLGKRRLAAADGVAVRMLAEQERLAVDRQ